MDDTSSNRKVDPRGSYRYGDIDFRKRTRPAHTEDGAAGMLSLKVACNPSIVETITRPDHTEAGATDMISFKVACNTYGNMVATISRSRGLWG